MLSSSLVLKLSFIFAFFVTFSHATGDSGHTGAALQRIVNRRLENLIKGVRPRRSAVCPPNPAGTRSEPTSRSPIYITVSYEMEGRSNPAIAQPVSFKTSIIHFPTSEGVSKVSEQANE